MHTYRIIWNSGNERQIQADSYSTVGEFIDFIAKDDLVLRVRASNVWQIEMERRS